MENILVLRMISVITLSRKNSLPLISEKKFSIKCKNMQRISDRIKNITLFSFCTLKYKQDKWLNFKEFSAMKTTIVHLEYLTSLNFKKYDVCIFVSFIQAQFLRRPFTKLILLPSWWIELPWSICILLNPVQSVNSKRMRLLNRTVWWD